MVSGRQTADIYDHRGHRPALRAGHRSPSSPKPLLKTNEHLIPTSVSADGRFLLYAVANMGTTRIDIWVLPLMDPEKRFPLIQRDFDQWQGQFSPDGRWVAYVSNESGRSEVLVRRFARLRTGERPNQRPSLCRQPAARRRDGGLVAKSCTSSRRMAPSWWPM